MARTKFEAYFCCSWVSDFNVCGEHRAVHVCSQNQPHPMPPVLLQEPPHLSFLTHPAPHLQTHPNSATTPDILCNISIVLVV